MTHTDQTETREQPSERPVERARDREDVSRRTMLRGVAVGGLALPLLAACGGGDETSESTSPSSGDSAESSPSESESAAAAGGVTVAVADVPVGGGTILKDEKLVVTQPAKGEFKAFSAICTHKGCPVAEITGKEIVCKCHGSHFSITDGSPTKGPADKPLGTKTATVKGDQVSVA